MIKLLNDFICTLVRCNIQLVRAYPTSKPMSDINRTILARGLHPMYDALDRGPTSSRRVGSRRRVRWLGASVWPMHRHRRRVRRLASDVGPMHRYRRHVRWLGANVGFASWPLHTIMLQTYFSMNVSKCEITVN